MSTGKFTYSKSIPQTYVDWYISKTSEPDEKFLSWISKVEKTIQKKMSMNLIDLPDEDYMRYFESNYTPNEMVKIIYETNGFV
jgi:hypothetical protein